MMNLDLGKWSFDNKRLLYFLLAVLCVGGLLTAYDMSKLEDPEIKVKTAMVVAIYPGASAYEVELQAADPLEKAIRSLAEVDNVASTIYSDLAIIQVDLKTTTADSDVDQCWDKLRRKVSDTAAALPTGVSVRVQDDFGLVYGMFYALTGEGLSYSQLSDYADFLKRELGNIDGVARVISYGERHKCINIKLKTDKLAMLGISPARILTILQGQNSVYYAGYFNSGGDRVRISVSDRLRAVDEIGNMLIQGNQNDMQPLKNFAEIEEDYETPVRNAMYFNGKPAIGIAIAGTSGSDIVKVGAAVEKKLEELKAARFPAGIECEKVFYQPYQVSSALYTFFINLIESVLIVIAILMFSMGVRSGLIIGISLVVTVVGTFLILGFFNGTMQRVSLAAFILAMGMLVDNAIVIIDGILVDLKQGKPKMEALTSIGKKTQMPLLGATLIACLAFLPIFLSPDTAGVYVRDLFIVLTVSLVLSWILALTHVPIMASNYLKVPAQASADTEMYNGKVYSMLGSVLRVGLRHRMISLLVACVLVALSVFGFKYVRQGFFPDMVYSQLYMEYRLPEGTNSNQVEKDLKEIEAYLHTRPEIGNVVLSVGGTPARYNLVRSIATPTLSYGELIIDFESPEALDANIDELQKILEQRYPSAYLKLKKYNIMYKKYPIEAVFSGPDPDVLHKLAKQAQDIMMQDPNVSQITTDWAPKVPMFEVAYDQALARRAGVSRGDISLSMLSGAGGVPVETFYDGFHKNTIYVKVVDENNPDGMSYMSNTPIFSLLPNINGVQVKEALYGLLTRNTDAGEIIKDALKSVPLGQVSDGIKVKWEDPVVMRYNNKRAQTVMCSPAPGVETEKARKSIAEKIEAIELPVGYDLQWNGEKQASTQTMKYLFQNLPVAIILIILLLILLFKDYKKPLIILSGIPLIAVGVVLAMLLTGKAFTFCAIVGALGLLGMMIKNGIVLMDEISDELKAGKEPVDALVESALSRLRPVVMASLTTILGMIPLLSDAMFGSMAAAIMGGLTFSTFATLIFLPIIYAVFFGIKAQKK